MTDGCGSAPTDAAQAPEFRHRTAWTLGPLMAKVAAPTRAALRHDCPQRRGGAAAPHVAASAVA
ncbi:hypothetical protein GCM10010233_35700 [Streptomyces pseudogriseolus]|uniref:Uncharacterized protein n=1 Tax=Streptomyces pseudogriseolus TaxID=36817 RepID=A0ABQ2T4G4_STREZ|nr:hypothetical protein GCM10010233_35700 [Streptomyces gancidicus]GGS49709.1 hypothetical protein GCM10010285_31530 [Streptomyces rubiginosus]